MTDEISGNIDTTKQVHKNFFDELNSIELNISGIWSVYFIEGAQKFKTLGYYFAKSKNISNEIYSRIEKEEIYVGFGSNGWAYDYFSNNTKEQICFLNDTYSDPRGTVIEIDYTIGQKHTSFVAIKDLNKKVIGIIMIFRNKKYQVRKDKVKIIDTFNNYELYFRLLSEIQQLKNSEAILSISPNKTKAENTTESIKSNLKNLLDNFLKINNQLSIEFLYVINKNKTAPEYISFSELFLKKIEYEMKFCSYLNGDSVKCKYFNKRKKNCNCQYFLDPFFFEVVNNLTCKTINIGNFSIKLYFKTDIKNISKFIRGISIDSTSLNGIAKEKYENEVITKRIEEILQNTAFVVCLVYRSKEMTSLIKANDCYRQDKYEENIRPTNVLPYYYNEEYRGLDLLGKYSPLKHNSFPFTKGKAAHIVSVLWNKNGNFNQLLNLHILNKWSEDTKISAYFGDSLVNKIDCELFTLHGINQTQLEKNSIAKSFLELGEKDYTILLQLQDTQLHATRAAISQVFARNMSHNIGSHVLSKYKDANKISEVESNQQYLPIHSKQIISNNGINQDFYIASFNEYLKNRMDFLADIATTDPVMESPLNFVSDILQGFDKNLILLNRISGIDSTIKYSLIVSKNDSKIIKKGETFRDLENDFGVSTPNDILGAQAWYILLENVIRNIYKHANPAFEFQICIDFKDYEADKSYYEVSVYDNLCRNERKIIEIVNVRNSEIDKKVLKDNKLRDGGLGTIEMKVCAAFIRKLPILDIERDEYLINGANKLNQTTGDVNDITPENIIICAYKHQIDTCKNNTAKETCNKTDCYTLGYKFFVSKPKEVLVVSTNPSGFEIRDENNILIDLSENGIFPISPMEINEKSIYPHQLLYSLDCSEDTKGQIRSHKAYLPKRILYHDDNNITVNKGKCAFFKSLWSAYFLNDISHFFKDKGANSIGFKRSNQKLQVNLDKEITLKKNNEVTENSDFNIFIDNHNYQFLCKGCNVVIDECMNSDYKSEKENSHGVCIPPGKINYYDMSCSHSLINRYSTKFLTRNAISDFGYQKLLEYLESVMHKIVIIDERIQQNIVFEKRKYSEIGPLFYEYFEQQGLIIPFWDNENRDSQENEVNLNADLLSKDEITSFIAKHANDVDFIIMHLGLVERLLGNDKSKEKVNEMINDLFEKIATQDDQQSYNLRGKLIITSGRGSPPTVPEDINYLPFTVLQHAVETVYDKFYLTKTLFNSRKIERNEK